MNLLSVAFWRRRCIDLKYFSINLTGIGKSDVISLHGNLFDLSHPRMTKDMTKALHYGSYELPEIELIKRHIKPNDRVIELGVGLGATSLILHDLVGSGSLCVFDADKRNIAMAKRNFEINEKHITCRNFALASGAERPRTIRIVSNANPLASAVVDVNRTGGEMELEVETLDFEQTIGEFEATALVLDIEGGEYDLLMNAAGFGSLKTMVMETHAADIGEENNIAMLDRLTRAGFEIAETTANGAVLALKR